tara:strand:- start:96 stop:662 length:567 start_codon:yes stop_codon:yes gene_type:complete
MKTKLKVFICLSSLIFGIFLGMFIYKYNIFPLSLYRSFTTTLSYPYGIFCVPYSKGTPLFSDRIYNDSLGNKELENVYVIQLPRHYDRSIQLQFDKPVTIYRILSKKNDNSYFDDWELLKNKVFVKGASVNHELVVKKSYDTGIIVFPSGGAITSSPILVKYISNEPINSLLINQIKLNTTFGLTNNL